jgi:peptidoglycan/xylan/chitin deacetylase (PgdA/CDA1 family)
MGYRSVDNLNAIPTPVRNSGDRIVYGYAFEDHTQLPNTYAPGGTGDSYDDAFHVRSGVQSVQFHVPDGKTNAFFRDGDLIGADGAGIDISQANWVQLRFWQPPIKQASVSAYLYSDGTTSNYLGVGNFTGGGTNRELGWHTVTLPFDPTDDTHGFDCTDMTGLGLAISGTGGDYVVADRLVLIQSLTSEPPVFIWRFDDGWTSEYTMAAVLEQYGWLATIGIVPSTIGDASRMSLEQLRDLDARGHLLVSHTWSHQPWDSITLSEREAEVVKARRWLIRQGLVRGADVLINPYNFQASAGDAQATMDMVFRHCRCMLPVYTKYRDAALSGSTLNQPYVQDPLDGRIIGLYKADSDITDAAIDQAITYGGGVHVLLAHHVDAGGLTLSDFQARCAYLRSREQAGQCRVMNLDQYLSWLAAQ